MTFATIPPDFKFTFVCRVLPDGKVSFSPPPAGQSPLPDRFETAAQRTQEWASNLSCSSHTLSSQGPRTPSPPAEAMDTDSA